MRRGLHLCLACAVALRRLVMCTLQPSHLLVLQQQGYGVGVGLGLGLESSPRPAAAGLWGRVGVAVGVRVGAVSASCSSRWPASAASVRSICSSAALYERAGRPVATATGSGLRSQTTSTAATSPPPCSSAASPPSSDLGDLGPSLIKEIGTAIASTCLPPPGSGGRSAPPQASSGPSPPAAASEPAGSEPGAAPGLVPVALGTSLHGSAMLRRTGRAPLIASWHNSTSDDPL